MKYLPLSPWSSRSGHGQWLEFEDLLGHRQECLLLGPWAGRSAGGFDRLELGTSPFRISGVADLTVSLWEPRGSVELANCSCDEAGAGYRPFQHLWNKHKCLLLTLDPRTVADCG